jgi:UDP-N-acetylglucosamine 2-epimerase (non-hydrolysing)
MLNVLTIFGTRPEAIKLAPVIKELQKASGICSKVAVTGQHRQMLDQVLDLFQIKPDVDLNIMLHNQSLFQITNRSLTGLEKLFDQERPDLVLVQGDTTTCFAAALSAFYCQIPVGHVEAGLRTENKYNPFPEEMNRRLTTVLSDLHFAPTDLAKENLIQCGVPEKKIFVTGNTIVDALQNILEQPIHDAHPVLERIPHNSRIILVEAHRRENLGNPMENICQALDKLVENFPDLHLIFSVHKNPKVREVVYRKLQNKERIFLIEPVDYPTLIHLQSKAYLILTDSGGIQEEAPSLGKPVLVMRKTTERPEGVKAGVAKLVGTNAKSVFLETARLLKDKKLYNKMSRIANPYGDGKASKRIVQIIQHHFKRKKEK